MNYKGIIFDLDGTLADTLDDIAGSMNRVLMAHGYPIHPVNHYKLLVGRGLDNLVAQALPPAFRQPSTISACLGEMMTDYSLHCLDKTCLYKGIPDLLDELIRRKISLAVFSNKSEPLTIKIVDQLLADVPFVKVVGARPDFPKKPDPAVALSISEQMGVSPHELIYIGDSDVDMITANRAGMLAVGVSWGFRSRKELLENNAKVILDHPMDLLDKLFLGSE